MTHAPGHSAFNYVKRRITILSKVVAGFVLPHESDGTQLHNNGKTIDENLGKLNESYENMLWTCLI